MPNWTVNTLIVRGTQEQLAAFKNKLAGDNWPIDFCRIRPMPESLNIEAGGDTGQVEVEEQDETLIYRFDTAWDCPRPLVQPIAELARGLGLSLVWEADHEDGGYEAVYDGAGNP